MRECPPTRALESLVALDPESLPAGTDPRLSFRYIDISAAANGRLTLPNDAIEYRDAPSRARRVLRNGDVLMATVRPNLRAFAYCDLPEGNFVASTGFAVLRAMNGADPHFILCAILSDDLSRQIDRYVVGSNYPAINSSDVRRLQLPAFEPEEQRGIGRVITTLDKAIEQTEALIAKTQQIKAGLMHDLFTRGVTANGQLRPPREEAPQLYKESPLGWIPKEWDARPLSEITDLITVGIVIRPAQYYVAEGVPAFRSANIREDGIDPSNMVFISPQSNALLSKSQVRGGDVLSVRTGYPGTSAVVPPEYAGANCIDLLISRPADCLRSAYLTAWINSPFGKEQVLRKQGGLAQQHFNVGELRDLFVAVPSVPEQDEIAARLCAVNGRLAEEGSLANKFGAVKHGLMHDLLTGRVRVPVAEAQKVGAQGGAQ